MGREIRRVPVDWEHPKNSHGHFRPLFDQNYDDACRQWWAEAKRYNDSPDKLDDFDKSGRKENRWFWDWTGPPPEDDCYLASSNAEKTHYQIYETVSEGTPVSPVFASLEDMVAWMVLPIERPSPWNDGAADWQCMQGMSPVDAQAFAGAGWAPSFSMVLKGLA